MKKDFYKNLVLTPATDEETQVYCNSVYILYKNKETDQIEIISSNQSIEEKTCFINLDNPEIELENIINERPIYMVETKGKQISDYTIVNGFDIPLENLLIKKQKELKKI